jgi:hypothetical protein
MRIDKENSVMAFDNMQDRAIKSTTGWQKYEVVLETWIKKPLELLSEFS